MFNKSKDYFKANNVSRLASRSINIASLTGCFSIARSSMMNSEIGCERRSRTFIFEFKARRVADYTIPQEIDSLIHWFE